MSAISRRRRSTSPSRYLCSPPRSMPLRPTSRTVAKECGDRQCTGVAGKYLAIVSSHRAAARGGCLKIVERGIRVRRFDTTICAARLQTVAVAADQHRSPVSRSRGDVRERRTSQSARARGEKSERVKLSIRSETSKGTRNLASGLALLRTIEIRIVVREHGVL
jgi:hypothetical protein